MEYLNFLISAWGYGLFYWFLYLSAYSIGSMLLIFAFIWGCILTARQIIFWFQKHFPND